MCRVIGAAAIRKYVNGVAGMGSAGGMSGSNLYAPKEFNKENIPEKVWALTQFHVCLDKKPLVLSTSVKFPYCCG